MNRPARPPVAPSGTSTRASRSMEWWAEGAMVTAGGAGDESFVADAATPDDAARLVAQHNADLVAAFDVDRLASAMVLEGLHHASRLDWRRIAAAVIATYLRLSGGADAPR